MALVHNDGLLDTICELVLRVLHWAEWTSQCNRLGMLFLMCWQIAPNGGVAEAWHWSTAYQDEHVLGLIAALQCGVSRD